jgi:osmoprotectant transport system permease protein
LHDDPGIHLNNQPKLLLGAVITALLALVLDGIIAAMTAMMVRHKRVRL